MQGLWIGDRLSLLEQLSIKSFLYHGHPYHLYTYQDVKQVPAGVILSDANDILPHKMIFQYLRGFGKGSFAGFADLFRYKLLAEKGGMWADLDLVCLHPFIFDAPHVFCTEYGAHDEPVISTMFIKAPVHSPCLQACFQEAAGKNHQELTFGEIGPRLLARTIRGFNLQECALPPNAMCPLKGIDYKEVVKPGFQFVLNHDSYAIHLWHEMWRLESTKRSIFKTMLGLQSLDKDRIYSPQSLYGRLQEMYL